MSGYHKDQSQQDPKKEKTDFDFTDVLAFTIAAFQIILPILAAFLGVIVLIYLVLRLLAR